MKSEKKHRTVHARREYAMPEENLNDRSLLPFFEQKLWEAIELPSTAFEPDNDQLYPGGEAPLDGYHDDGDYGEDVTILGERIYPIYDSAILFSDWMDLHIAEIRRIEAASTPKSLKNVGLLSILFQLMEESDLDILEDEIDVDRHPDIHQLYFLGEFYGRMRSLRDWDSIRTTEVEYLLYPKTLPGISWDEAVTLCQRFRDGGIAGNTENMVNVFKQIAQLCEEVRHLGSKHRLPNVLIIGEPGTGKEGVAKILHALSGRVGHFRSINCAAIPHELLESELFGVIGAYPGFQSPKGKEGIFEICEGGTLHLDEINKMPRFHQEKILRALEEREFTVLGETSPRSLDILFVAASNEDLSEKVVNGEFAPDLLGRLSNEVIELPAMRVRRENIPLLVRHFLQPYREIPLYHYRFPLVRWIMSRFTEVDERSASNNVRKIENLVGQAVRRSLKLQKLWDPDPKLTALKEAVSRAEKESGQSPVNLNMVATHLVWGKKSGYTPQTLCGQSSPWYRWVEQLREEGLIS